MNFLPDLNVWVALSVSGHVHHATAWKWLNLVPETAKLIFARYTQIGLLRLLTLDRMMGDEILTLRQAWAIYDQWLGDPRVEFYQEPRSLDNAFRHATAPFLGKPASKWIGDCYLLALAKETSSMLVTFDRALFDAGKKTDYAVVIPG